MRNPTLQGTGERIQRELTCLVLDTLAAKAADEPLHILAAETAVGWEDAETQKVNPHVHWEHDALFHMQRQAQLFKKPRHLLVPVVQLLLVVGKEQKVVHVAYIRTAAQFAFDELVEFVQIDVCPKLTGKVANRQSAR